jgi:predicted AAA+ superfamily ATPase
MNKDTIKKLIILSQEQKVNLVERDLEIRFAGRINTIIGPRRAGKTFFIYKKILT